MTGFDLFSLTEPTETVLCKHINLTLFALWQISEMLAVLISKIARFDYPREWLAFSLHSSY